MKKGQSITSIAAELERQMDSRKDYIAKQGAMEAVPVRHAGPEPHLVALKDLPAEVKPNDIAINGVNGIPMALTIHAHQQFAGALEIPQRYYDKMRSEQPELLARNINTWLKADPDRRRMIRTLDGKVRANLSDRYRPLDHFDLAHASFPALKEAEAQIVSAEITDLRFYIKAVFPQLSTELPEGFQYGDGQHKFLDKDLVVASVTISNSEVGAGSLKVEAGFFKTRCTNLAIFADAGMKKYHVGRSAVAELDSAVELFTDETRKADDKAFWMKVRDIVKASCNRDVFLAQVEKMKLATKDRIENKDLPQVIEITRKRFGLPELLQGELLTHLIEGRDLTRWGLLNAVTRTAEDQPNYDFATELERTGGQILELAPTEWKKIAG
jgi:hypothetical protein